MTRLPPRRKRPRSGIRDKSPEELRALDAHLQWVRGHVCCVDNSACDGPVQAAHVRMGLAGGMALKPPHDRVVPLCEDHHRTQHTMGERPFWREVGIDPVELAAAFAANWHSPLQRLRRRVDGTVVKR